MTCVKTRGTASAFVSRQAKFRDVVEPMGVSIYAIMYYLTRNYW
jgi:hypothetical protein